jgi:hypothetical protein
VANNAKALARGAFATSSGTIYTVPALTTAVITNIAIVNTSASTQTFTLSLDGVALHTTNSIAANTTYYIDLKQVLTTTKVIAGLASAVTVNYHISGIEIA